MPMLLGPGGAGLAGKRESVLDEVAERIAGAAVPMASIAEPHMRLMAEPGASSGKPASRDDMRATLRLSSPAWLTHPKMTSSTSDQSTEGLRRISSREGKAPKSSARMSFSAPP